MSSLLFSYNPTLRTFNVRGQTPGLGFPRTDVSHLSSNDGELDLLTRVYDNGEKPSYQKYEKFLRP